VTVAIAARAALGRALVTMTDRQLTIGAWALKAEQPMGKGYWGPGGWTCMYAQDSTYAEAVIARATIEWQGMAPEKRPTYQIGMLKHVHNAYLAHHFDTIDDSVLRPRGLTLAIWQERMTHKDFDPSLRAEIQREIDETDREAGCDLLLAGFDSGSAPEGHILTVGLRHEAHDTEWAAIGSGAEIAHGRLAWQRTSSFDVLQRVLYEVYEAARHASQNPAVGQSLSAGVMTGNGEKNFHDVPPRIMSLLEAIFWNHDRTPFRNPAALRGDDPSIPPLQADWEVALTKWSDEVMATVYVETQKP